MKAADEYTPKFGGYRSLMPNRIHEILFVSNLYDAFILEEDGSLTEQIWSQYVGLRLTDPPHVRRVSSVERALMAIEEGGVDLVLVMIRLSDNDPFEFADRVKKINPGLPVVLLASDPYDVADLPVIKRPKSVDHIFLWNNDTQILLAIIKLVEDRRNLDHDISHGQVRAILLLEDSIVHYSAFLPNMYAVVMDLTRRLIDDGFNDLHKQLRMRSRAKILLAETYEEGMALYERYRKNILGVISDVRFWRNGIHDKDAGYDFIRNIKGETPDIPVVLQSAEPEENRWRAHQIGAEFLDKGSPHLLTDLRRFLKERMGFGDFVFRMSDGREVGRAGDVYEFVHRLAHVPVESVIWHAEHNHISNWLMARTEVTMAEHLRPRRVTEFPSHEDVRRYVIETISAVLADKETDVVAHFSMKRPYQASNFLHLGQGSLGGKGRGIAFIRYLAKRQHFSEDFPEVDIAVPRTLVIGAGEFDTFLDANDLRHYAIESEDEGAIRRRFIEGRVQPQLVDNLRFYLRRIKTPIAVRSSSLLEDSHLQPFAGLYNTYMLPNTAPSRKERLNQLLMAIKLVWASTFGRNPRAYFAATSHRLEEEKMAVVIQEVVGKRHGSYYYPTFSGVGQSVNFYPFGVMKAEDGVAHLALGLGKMVVDGGSALRFSPAYPGILPQFSSPDSWLSASQKQFYALRMDQPHLEEGSPDANLKLLELSDAEAHGELGSLGSVYLPADHVIRDSLSYDGPRVVTFAGILKYHEFPLAKILKDLFQTFEEAMGCPIEMEFAVNLWPAPKRPELKLLQIRPLIAKGENEQVAVTEEDCNRSWCHTELGLGNGVHRDLTDIVYVKPETFDRAMTRQIADEVGRMNDKLKAEKRGYILVGFGRWGSTDPWLGIGVDWAQIAGARVIIEASRPDFQVDPSNGTHFFQNITSLGIGYLTVPNKRHHAHIDWDWLDSRSIVEETTYLRHVRLDRPTTVRIDGRQHTAVAIKPEMEETGDI